MSGCNSCTFCFGAHKAVAEAFGIDGTLIDELVKAEVPSAAGAKIQPCLVLAGKAAREANRIVKEDIDLVINAGWREETAHDVICIAALANCANTLVSGHGIVGSPDYIKREAEKLGPDGGYSSDTLLSS